MIRFFFKHCFIFPHIPKCGGTSLKKLITSSDLQVFYDYEFPPHSSQKYFNDLCERRNHEFNMINFKNFDVVFGHFPIARYQARNYQYITLLRHPVDRAVSHYLFWKHISNENSFAIAREPVIKQIKEGRIDFKNFLEHQALDKFYLSYLSEFKPEDFALVGFLDNYSFFLDRLSQLLNITPDSRVHERKGVKEELPDHQIEFAHGFLKKEIERYYAFRKFWLK